MKKFEFITVTGKRVKETEGLYKGFVKTEIYNPDGTLKCTFPAAHIQPRKDKKFITLNCFKYKINWI